MKVIVVGGGRMGLPLACLFAENGADVTVCDINRNVVDAVESGRCPYEEPGLAEYLARNHAAGRLHATNNTTTAAGAADVIVIIVPAHLTPDRDIDYTILKSAATAAAKGLRKGALVSFETTVSVGGTRNVLIPVLEEHSGLRAGRDFKICFSPERVKANRVFEKLQETPKVVGGFDPESARAAEEFYDRFLGARVVNVGTLEAAEFAKLADMLYRDVNIALANELAAYSEVVGADFNLVREAANTGGEANLLLPGIGVGGHCTPVYPYFVIRDGVRRGKPQRLAALAREINEMQPAQCVQRLASQWQPLAGRRVHIMGLGFRPDVKVDTFSTAYAVRDALAAHRAVVTLEDPLYTDEELRKAGFQSARVGKDPLDAVIGNTAHSAFRTPDFTRWHASGVRAVLDGRDMWNKEAAEAAGLLYLRVGAA